MPHPNRSARALVFLLLPVLAGAAAAQNNYEIQIYGSQTVDPGATFVELHSNTATQGPETGAGGPQPDEGSIHETLEVTRGFTKWFETGFYLFSSARAGEGWSWTGWHVRPRVSVPESWHWPVGASLSAEVGYFRPEFSESRWDMEIRPIVDWRRGPLYISINPAFERNLALYDGGSRSFHFAPGAKVGWDFTALLSAGVEYYSDWGAVEGLSSVRDQEHQIFPVVDLHFSPDWEFNAGAGFGLTRPTDRVLLKVILGRRFGA